jgi:hypothetical protein
LVVGQAVGTLLLVAPTARHNHRDRRQPKLCRRTDAPVTGNQITFLVNQHRVGPSPFADGGGKLVDVGLAMEPGIVRIGDQPFDRPVLNPFGRPGTCRPGLCELRLTQHI